MDTADGTDAFVLGKRKRKHEPDDPRQRERERVRNMSQELVNSGQIPRSPCLICGSRESLKIQHIEPMRPDRFVFLCKPCHDRANRPFCRTVSVLRFLGQFSVRPEAVLPREEVSCG